MAKRKRKHWNQNTSHIKMVRRSFSLTPMFVEHELEETWFLSIWELMNLVIVMHFRYNRWTRLDIVMPEYSSSSEADRQLEGVMGVRDVIAKNSTPPPVHLRDFAITICWLIFVIEELLRNWYFLFELLIFSYCSPPPISVRTDLRRPHCRPGEQHYVRKFRCY